MSEPAPEIAQWLPEARAGSREALGRALEACRDYLLLVANRQLDPDLRAKGGASDLVQETFLEAQRDFSQFRGTSGGELLAWLRQMLLHNLGAFRRHYRYTGKRRVDREVSLTADGTSSGLSLEPAGDSNSPSGQAMELEETQAVQRALDRLPDDYRRVVVYRYREGRSFEEIAELMQRSANAVRKLWFRAVERLQQQMENPS
jgi:RNA polymerase sigma-70 factor (ECF subfamily)